MNATAELYLRGAQSHLRAAQFCHEGAHRGPAVAEAYHSVLASIKVRLLKRGKKLPNSHSRSLALLYHEFVEEDDIESDTHSFVHKLQSYRDDWNYEAEVPDLHTTSKAIKIASTLKDIVDPNAPPQESVAE